jgi:hypothetical protein
MHGLAVVGVIACSANASTLVGYWNFNNMTTVLPANMSDAATPGITSSAPGPLGLISRNTITNMGSPGPAYEGFRADFYPGGGYSAVPPNGLNALNGDADAYGLRLGNGSAEFIRNGEAVWFPLASMSDLTDLRMSLAMYSGGPRPFTDVRILWNTSMSATGWHLLSSFSPAGTPWGRADIDLGTNLAGIETPWIALQLDGGGTFASFILDNVQFNAVPAPSTLIAVILILAVPARRCPQSGAESAAVR